MKANVAAVRSIFFTTRLPIHRQPCQTLLFWSFLFKRPRQEANCQGPCARASGAGGLRNEDPATIAKAFVGRFVPADYSASRCRPAPSFSTPDFFLVAQVRTLVVRSCQHEKFRQRA